MIARGEQFAEKLTRLAGQYTRQWTASWGEAAPADNRPSPVFLVGFPRSGTTLLENFLRGHDAFAVIEERLMAAITALRWIACRAGILMRLWIFQGMMRAYYATSILLKQKSILL